MEIDGLSTERLEKMYKKEKDPKAKLRLLALIHRREGKSFQEIGKMIRMPFTTVRDWIKKVEKEGLDGIYNSERKGRPPKLSSEGMKQLRDDLARRPEAFGHEKKNWTTRLIDEHISENYGVS